MSSMPVQTVESTTRRDRSQTADNDDPLADADTLPEFADRTFRVLYTGLDIDIEVELVDIIDSSESPYRHGHNKIDRPEWDEPKAALNQNIEVVCPDCQ